MFSLLLRSKQNASSDSGIFSQNISPLFKRYFFGCVGCGVEGVY